MSQKMNDTGVLVKQMRKKVKSAYLCLNLKAHFYFLSSISRRFYQFFLIHICSSLNILKQNTFFYFNSDMT